METITLYHGSPKSTLFPTFGLGEEKHDYGKGLYLTPDIELAREWAVCDGTDGFLYKIDLDLNGLVLLDFDDCDPLAWIAELMRHRAADTSIRLAKYFGLSDRYFLDIQNDIDIREAKRNIEEDLAAIPIAI